VGTADNGSQVAIDLGYAPFHQDPKISRNSKVETKDTKVDKLSAVFKIVQENDLLEQVCFSHKPADSTSRVEIEATIKSPLFKHRMAQFFEKFPLSSRDIKSMGNVEFEEKDYYTSLLWYSLGIAYEENVKDGELIHVLFSNRSAAYYQLHLYNEALEDAESAIRLAPMWPKGYLRKSAVLTALGRSVEAQEVADKMEAVEKELAMPKNKKKKQQHESQPQKQPKQPKKQTRFESYNSDSSCFYSDEDGRKTVKHHNDTNNNKASNRSNAVVCQSSSSDHSMMPQLDDDSMYHQNQLTDSILDDIDRRERLCLLQKRQFDKFQLMFLTY